MYKEGNIVGREIFCGPEHPCMLFFGMSGMQGLATLFLFFNFWLCWVFVAGCGLPLVAASGGYSSLGCAGLLRWFLLLQSLGSRRTGISSGGTQAQ